MEWEGRRKGGAILLTLVIPWQNTSADVAVQRVRLGNGVRLPTVPEGWRAPASLLPSFLLL